MNAPAAPDWTSANKALLQAEFARLTALLREGGAEAGAEESARADIDAAKAQIARCQAMLPHPAAIDIVTQLFGLSAFERDLVLLLAGVELDSTLAGLCTAGGSTVARVSFGMALATLTDPHWSALAPIEPLRRWHLVLTDPGPLTNAALRLDERILHFLAGIGYVDPAVAPILAPVPAPGAMLDSHEETARRIAANAARQGEASMALIEGDDPGAHRDVAVRAAAEMGLGLLALQSGDIPGHPHDRHATALLVGRDMMLTGSALLIEVADKGGKTALRFARGLPGFVFLSSRDPAPGHRDAIRVQVDRPGAATRRALWQRHLDQASPRDPDQAPAHKQAQDMAMHLADTYAMTAGQIDRIARTLVTSGPGAARAEVAAETGRRRADLAGLATRIEPRATWDDLVLPDAQTTILRQIAQHVRLRAKVEDDWGFAGKSSRGLGLSTLFWGDSGTGKTLAAEVLGRTLDRDVWRIDLANVVSKYIGETEKNLARVFQAAEESAAILLFDEADALFGKRSEVRDSHDRYANIEVSYLLQRIEAYTGLAILTTNAKSALDPAFLRRLRFVVQFPFPDAVSRAGIWRAVLPARLPQDGVDTERLAQLAVSGGTIRNIALSAAFLAAEAGGPVTMAHLRRAARMDAAKRDTSLSDAETRGWE